jgi:hypothetical protein
MDVVERRIASTGAQLMILEKAFSGWSPHSEEHETVNQFERYDIPSFSRDSFDIYGRPGPWKTRFKN